MIGPRPLSYAEQLQECIEHEVGQSPEIVENNEQVTRTDRHGCALPAYPELHPAGAGSHANMQTGPYGTGIGNWPPSGAISVKP